MARILWIIAGIAENESLIGVARQLVKQTPEHGHSLVTNCKNYSTFPGCTYALPDRGELAKTLDVFYRDCVVAACEEGLIEKADLIITGSWYAALLLYLFGVKNKRVGDLPVAYLKATQSAKDIADEGDYCQSLFWKITGSDRNVWAIHFDNDNEQKIVDEWAESVCPSTKKATIARMISYRFEGFRDIGVEKENVVAWSGRFNTAKNPMEAARIVALASPVCKTISRAYVVSKSVSGGEMAEFQRCFNDVQIGLPSKPYVELVKRAKVGLVTAIRDAFPFGTIEMMEHGIIPVFKKRPWNESFAGGGWPLRYRNDADAVAMIDEALTRYDHYRALLEGALFARYSKSPNWKEITDRMLAHADAKDVRKEFSSSFAAGRVF